LDFVKAIYSDFKESLSSASSSPLASAPKRTHPQAPKESAPKPKAKSKAKSASSSNGKLDKSLDLSGTGNKPSLKDFLSDFKATSNISKNIVFLEYLSSVLDISPITIDHIYTCHDATGKIPGALKQSLYDTSAAGFINLPSIEDISLAVKGINWIKENRVSAQKN